MDAGYSDRIDVEYDVLKIAVVERHKNTRHIGTGFLQGYGLRSGAVATSISPRFPQYHRGGHHEQDMGRRRQPCGGHGPEGSWCGIRAHPRRKSLWPLPAS